MRIYWALAQQTVDRGLVLVVLVDRDDHQVVASDEDLFDDAQRQASGRRPGLDRDPAVGEGAGGTVFSLVDDRACRGDRVAPWPWPSALDGRGAVSARSTAATLDP